MRLVHLRDIHRRVPEATKADIQLEWDKTSIDRIRLVSWMSITVYALLFFVDWARSVDGEIQYVHPAYRWLTAAHAAGIAFLPVALASTIFHKTVKESALYRGLVIYGFFAVMVIAVYSHAVLTLHITGSLVLYVAFILIANWALAMKVWQRASFTAISLGLYLFFIFDPIDSIYIYEPSESAMVDQLIKTFEVTFMTLIAMIFGFYDEGYRLLNFFQRHELKADKEKVEQLERSKSHLFANVAHEIRTPLTVISGLTSQLLDNLHDGGKERLAMIDRNAGRMLELVNQIMTLSKLEEGDVELKVERLDFVSFIHYVEDCFQGHAKSSGVEFIVEVPYVVLSLETDKEILFKVLSNLLSNAFKYTAEGGKVTLTSSVLSDDEGEKLILSVRDTGVGISKTDLPYVFERFYRTNESELSGPQGTGIGLSIVKELVNAMNGEVSVESILGLGSEFKLTIPVNSHSILDSTESYKDGILSSGLELESENSDYDFSKGTVLVVEDNRDVNELIATTLKPDFRVIQAYDGVHGALLAEDLMPDAILSDIKMPRKDGLEFCRELKNSQLTSHIPIFLLTGVIDNNIRTQGLEAGALDIIAKPFNTEELHAKILNTIEWREKLRAKYADENWDNEETPKSPEEEFLFEARSAIRDHLDNADFRVTDLCRALGMSRTQLHNKLKAVTGKSTTAFIRDMRLHASRALLLNDGLTISEVAYDVGFADPSYFTRVFTGVYGISPTEFRQTEKAK